MHISRLKLVSIVEKYSVPIDDSVLHFAKTEYLDNSETDLNESVWIISAYTLNGKVKHIFPWEYTLLKQKIFSKYFDTDLKRFVDVKLLRIKENFSCQVSMRDNTEVIFSFDLITYPNNNSKVSRIVVFPSPLLIASKGRRESLLYKKLFEESF